MRYIEQRGFFEIHADAEIMHALDALLRAFVEQRRMKMVGEYKPCFRVLGQTGATAVESPAVVSCSGRLGQRPGFHRDRQRTGCIVRTPFFLFERQIGQQLLGLGSLAISRLLVEG